jgi:hypothetical protein
MRNISHKSCRENQNPHFFFRKIFTQRAVYEIKWKNMAEPGTPHMAVRRMRFACWISKAADALRI